MSGRTLTAMGAVAAIALFAPVRANAQPASGPMTIERIHSGLILAGDAKITEVDHHTSELVGGQVGWILDDTISIGGGGYWLANGSRNRKMAYGGLVVQWLGHRGDRFGYGAKALLGGGQATLADTITTLVPVRISRTAPITTTSRTFDVRFERNFFVAEPEANVSFRITSGIRLTGGVGYRLVGAEGRDDDRLRGATATVGFQIF